MFSYHRFSWLLMMQVFVSLMNLGDAHESVPFHLVQAKLNFTIENVTMVEFPTVPALKGASLSLSSVDYESRILEIYESGDCPPRFFLQRLYNSSIYPFQFDYSDMLYNLTFLDCSSFALSSFCSSNISICSSNISTPDFLCFCPIFAVSSEDGVLAVDGDILIYCTLMFQLVSPIPAQELNFGSLRLRWPKADVEKHKTSKILTVALPSTGPLVLVLLFIFGFYIYHFFKKIDDQARLEKFIDDYRALKPTRFSYADLKRITNHFKKKLGEGAHGTVFKGQLSTDIEVAVKILNHSETDGKEFINEVGTMGKIHHINVVRLLGFCADGFHRALVYDFFPNGCLQKFISTPDNKEHFLGWMKLQEIALAIAKGIEYLHQGCDYRILHFDINPCNILLDHNFTPKISDFGLAKLCSKNQSTVSMTAVKGTLGYIAPEVFSRNFGNVSYKSDIYSYGMLLLEMVGGRKNVDTNQETFKVMYPGWIHNFIEGGDINIYIEDDDEVKIAKKLAIVGLWCIQWHPTNRPSMKMVIQMLEGKVDKLKTPPIPFDFATSTNTSTIIPPRHMNFELEVIHELQ